MAREQTLDETTIRQFLETDYRRLVAGFSLLADGQALAEEAVQEALVRAWARSQRGEGIDSLTAWVATVAANILRSGLRRRVVERRARRRLGARAQEAGEPSEASAVARVDVGRAIRALPPRQRQVVVLRYFADLDTAEIGRALRMREGAVRAALYRARTALAVGLAVAEVKEGSDVATG